jgi:hypothetical protein
MSKVLQKLSFLYERFLSDETKKKAERATIFVAIIGFALHLMVYMLVELEFIRLNDFSKLLKNPIAAIYTPFTFILIFEIYLLIYYIPRSISTYISKQYEIITLILIRRVFKDLANLEFTENWFQNQGDLQFTYDILATLILFALIFLFYKLNRRAKSTQKLKEDDSPALVRFIRLKKIITLILVPVLLILATYSFSHWINDHFLSVGELVESIKDVNKVFFDDFFTLLILVDVFLLLFSFLITDKFHKVIRNSGFVISTTLIKLSFSTTGILNTILVVSAVLFGLCVLAIHNLFERMEEKPLASVD